MKWSSRKSDLSRNGECDTEIICGQTTIAVAPHNEAVKIIQAHNHPAKTLSCIRREATLLNRHVHEEVGPEHVLAILTNYFGVSWTSVAVKYERFLGQRLRS